MQIYREHIKTMLIDGNCLTRLCEMLILHNLNLHDLMEQSICFPWFVPLFIYVYMTNYLDPNFYYFYFVFVFLYILGCALHFYVSVITYNPERTMEPYVVVPGSKSGLAKSKAIALTLYYLSTPILQILHSEICKMYFVISTYICFFPHKRKTNWVQVWTKIWMKIFTT